jgi:hypothetical protein
MKTNRLLLILIIPLLIGITSCSEDFLEVTPSHAISAESVFADTSKIDAFLTGLYDNNSYFYYVQSALMEADIRGKDIFLVPSGNYGRFDDEYMYNLTTDHWQVDDIWETAYSVIANCNQAVQYVPEGSYSDAFKNSVLAEARAMRASAYLILIHFYAQPYSFDPNGPGVPITKEPLNPDPASDFPARSTVQEVYDLIIEDLKFAQAHINNTDIIRLTKNAVHGLLARAYLDMEDWANARDHAISAYDGHPLMSGSELLAGFADPNDEWIWSLNMRSDDNNGYLMLPSFYDTRVMGYSSFRATNTFASLFEAGDARSNMFGVPDNGGMTITKYLHRTEWDMDQVLMRSAEMYLIEAEARAQLDDAPGALTALNAVQSRAGATLTTTTDKAELLEAIALERRKELFGEGFHLLDILRRGETLERTDAAHWAPVDLEAYDPLMIFPIPQAEIDANPNINEADQNEGYR